MIISGKKKAVTTSVQNFKLEKLSLTYLTVITLPPHHQTLSGQALCIISISVSVRTHGYRCLKFSGEIRPNTSQPKSSHSVQKVQNLYLS